MENLNHSNGNIGGTPNQIYANAPYPNNMITDEDAIERKQVSIQYILIITLLLDIESHLH